MAVCLWVHAVPAWATATPVATVSAPPAAAAPSAPIPAPAASAGAAPPDTALDAQVQALLQGTPLPPEVGGERGALRLQVQVGRLDPRLRLAPCARVEPFLPPGLPRLGATRVGLRCVDGPTRWRVTLPVTVHLWGRGVVAATTLAAGTPLAAQHLGWGEVDFAAPGGALARPQALIGRVPSQAIAAGAPIQARALRARQWFAAGDTVRLVAAGGGWSASATGRAVTAGVEGRPASVRLESGRLVQGRPTSAGEVAVVF